MNVCENIVPVSARTEKGFSLLEVMVAVGIAGMLMMGLGETMTRASYANMFREDRVISFKAAHQTLEVLLGTDLDTMILQNGNTFTVGSTHSPLSTADGTNAGTVTITDLQWEGIVDKSYLIDVSVDEFNVHLSTVRTRY